MVTSSQLLEAAETLSTEVQRRIAVRLRQLREHHSLTANDVAGLLKVASAHVLRQERGRHNFRSDALCRYCVLYGISLAQLHYSSEAQWERVMKALPPLDRGKVQG